MEIIVKWIQTMPQIVQIVIALCIIFTALLFVILTFFLLFFKDVKIGFFEVKQKIGNTIKKRRTKTKK